MSGKEKEKRLGGTLIARLCVCVVWGICVMGQPMGTSAPVGLWTCR